MTDGGGFEGPNSLIPKFRLRYLLQGRARADKGKRVEGQKGGRPEGQKGGRVKGKREPLTKNLYE